MALTLTEVHKIYGKINLLGEFLHTLLSWSGSWENFFAYFSTDQDDIWCGVEAVKTEYGDNT